MVYEDFDHISALVLSIGQGAFIAKVHIQATFRILPIHPEDRHLLGFTWRGQYYFDNCLSMGCSISCALFGTFSSALQEALLSLYGFSCMSHMLDGFIFIGEANSAVCQWQLQQFLRFASLPPN